MLLWMAVGYVAAAVAFYSFIVKTAQEEPQEKTGVVMNLTEWQRNHDQDIRKAA